MNDQKQLRENVLELLEGKSAHIALDIALNKFPVEKINAKLDGAPHTAWELVEHLRIAQSDIVEFTLDANHVSPEFPDGYWSKQKGTTEDWKKSVEQILKDLQTMREIVANENNDLLAEIPHGDGQTILREALLVADHNAYHLGEIVFLMRTLESV